MNESVKKVIKSTTKNSKTSKLTLRQITRIMSGNNSNNKPRSLVFWRLRSRRSSEKEQAHKKRESTKRMDQADLLKNARHGNVAAVEKLIASYSNGWGGFPRDQRKACAWARRAHALGSVNGTALLGEMYLYGGCVEKDPKRAVALLSQAAGRGSDFAAFVLEEAFTNGTLATN